MKTVKLHHKISLDLHPAKPFNFDATVYVPQHFPTPDFFWEKGKLWQSMNFSFPIGLKMENIGATNKPGIKLTIYSENKLNKDAVDSIVSELNWRYEFGKDLSEFFKRFENDKFLKPAFKKLKGMRRSCMNSLYELLIISIVMQNATIRRTVQMMNALLKEYGSIVVFDGKELAVFWSPESISESDDLRALKVGYRDKMIKKISQALAQKEIDEFGLRGMGNDDAKKEITKLYGVGPATAQIILAEYLKKNDVFDLKGRVWEQKILSRVLFNKKLVPAEKILSYMKNKYGGWEGLSYYYIFTDIFWKHKEKKIEWLEKEIRL